MSQSGVQACRIPVMVGTGFQTMGGIASVVSVYRDAGFLQAHGVRYLASHGDGNALVKLRRMLTAWLTFMSLLMSRRVALLHAHTSSRASFWRKCLFFVPAMWLKVPTILHLHGSEFAIFYERECGTVRQRLVRMVFERCTRVVVLSDAWRDWVEAMAPGATVEVIYNPVCVPALADECGRQPDRVLFMGRLGQRKGTPELMAAGGELARRGRRFAFWLGGDGDAQGTLRQANDAGIAAQVKLLGWVTGSDKQTLLDESAIYCLPSHNEGLPMSILEAMASGLPVVSTRVGGIPEAVTDGVHGRVIEAGDVPALAAALDELLVQPELARRMGLAARQRVIDEFSAEAILPRLSLLYRSLSESRS